MKRGGEEKEIAGRYMRIDGERRRVDSVWTHPEMDTENRHYKLTTLIDGPRGRDDAGRSGG